MTGPAVDTRPALPSEGAELAVQAQATRDAARSLAQKLVAGTEQTPQTPLQDQTSTLTIKQVGEEVVKTAEQIAAEAAAAPVTQTETEGAEGEEQVDIAEVDAALLAAGIDIGVTSSDVPEPLRPVYEKVAQAALEYQAESQHYQSEAKEATERVQEFARQLKEQPDRVLLAVGLQNPDVFAKVAEMFQNMQADPNFKDSVIRELQSEARMKEVERRERAYVAQTQSGKAQQVIAATKKASRVHGVPYALAEEFVATAVRANGGDLEVAAVDGLVSKLKSAPASKPKPRVQTPVQQAKVNGAPTTPAGQAAAPPVTQPTTSAGLTATTPYGRFRSIIGKALAGQSTPNQ